MKERLLYGLLLIALLISQSTKAHYVPLTPLSGTGGTGGEGYAMLVDGDFSTKMGQSFDSSSPAYVIVKAEQAVIPASYNLVIANDTWSYPERNWKSWNIYGANFPNDDSAVLGSSGWELIDSRTGEQLPVEPNADPEFKINKNESPTAYQYYLIEITEAAGGDRVYLQMAEWLLYTEQNQDEDTGSGEQTDLDKPVTYTMIGGSCSLDGNEGLLKLVDGDNNTKWGQGFSPKSYGETAGGAYFIIRPSRAMGPVYYQFVTGTDNESCAHRNPKNWQIYGMKDRGVVPVRASLYWELLDKKEDISEEILPDKNCYTATFYLSEEVSQKYQYFKVEIDETLGSSYVQLSEFSLGDGHTRALEAIKEYDPNAFAEKTLLEELQTAIEKAKTLEDHKEVKDQVAAIDSLLPQIKESIRCYASLENIRKYILTCGLEFENQTYLELWAGEELISPCEDFPLGNFAYIKANRHITTEQAKAETLRIGEMISTHEYVDLGLPSGTLWATCNIGANNPEEYGDKFAWGETVVKEFCSRDNYTFTGDEIDSEHDAATVNWGPAWQMPTMEQVQELINSEYTTIEETTLNEVRGVVIKSNFNGSSIFLPCAGIVYSDGLNHTSQAGDYWTSTPIDKENAVCLVTLYFGELATCPNTTQPYRYTGRAIRPVRTTKVDTVLPTSEHITLEQEYTPFSCNKDLDFTNSEISAYVAVGFNKQTNQVVLVRAKEVPAGTGVLLIGQSGTTEDIPYTTSPVFYTNLFQACLTRQTIEENEGSYTNYVLGVQNDEAGFYKINGSTTLPSRSAYLRLPTSMVKTVAKVSLYFEEDVIDGIDEIKTDNHQIIYNLQGQRLQAPQKGINIIRGRKEIF